MMPLALGLIAQCIIPHHPSDHEADWAKEKPKRDSGTAPVYAIEHDIASDRADHERADLEEENATVH
jgi:hypothetical protein